MFGEFNIFLFYFGFYYVGLAKTCQVLKETGYKYRKLVKISDFPKLKPTGYLFRSTFYVVASHDAHFIFSPKELPDWKKDNVYEIRKSIIFIVQCKCTCFK